MSLAAFAVLVAFLWRDRGDFGLVVLGAVGLFFAWDAVRQLRSRRPASEMTLVLGPEALELSSSEPGMPAVRLSRDRAGWLVAAEMQTDWHLRYIWLMDAADREVARFVGSLAVVEVRRPGLPPATMLPAVVPVAVLLGHWWPHPARRTSRAGSAGLRFRWREPDLGAFPRHERRQRVEWSAFHGVFAVGCFWAALGGSSAEWIRLLFGLAGVGLIIWRVHVLRWRSTFLQGA